MTQVDYIFMAIVGLPTAGSFVLVLGLRWALRGVRGD